MSLKAYHDGESDPVSTYRSAANRTAAHIFGHWRQDVLSSLVVFLVALPLCMGIALASGAPIAAGLTTGIIGGLIVGAFAGAPLQVSGPAAGLTVICAQVIGDFGLAALGIVVLIAGALQLAAGLARLGQWFRAVSPAVVGGMLAGIGLLIVSSQLHVMVDDRPRESGLANFLSIPESLVKGMRLPAWEDASTRAARTEFLQDFGVLHERQAEIERDVARTVTEHGSVALHVWEQEHVANLVPQQRALAEDFRAAVARIESSPVAAGDGRRLTRVRRAIASAEQAIQQALANLENRQLGPAERSEAAAVQAVGEVLASLKNHDWAAKIGLLSIAVIVGWNFVARRSWRLIPAPLLAVLTATLATWFLALPVLYVEVPDDLVAGLTFPSWTVFQDVSYRELIVAGLMVAVIASAETLLCATAVDQMHHGPRTRYDRELAAQGVGNMLCGLVGALPMTGVIVRSAANVQAGAKTRLSTLLHGAWLLVFVLALVPLLRMIPTAALAGILVYTGFKLIDWKGFVRLWRANRSEAAIFLITVVVIVVEDLLMGVLTGVVLSAVKLLVTFSRLEVELARVPEGQGRLKAVLTLSGAATFLRLPLLAAKLEEVPVGAHLHVDFERLSYIDHACLELLMSWARRHGSTGGTLVIDWDSLHARFHADSSRRGRAIGVAGLPAETAA